MNEPKEKLEDFTKEELLQFAKDSKANNEHQQQEIERLQNE